VVPQGDAPTCVKSGLHVTIAVDNGGGAWAVRMGFSPADSFQPGGPGFFSCAVRRGENPGRSAFFFHH
jgi:hypothetical protein